MQCSVSSWESCPSEVATPEDIAQKEQKVRRPSKCKCGGRPSLDKQTEALLKATQYLVDNDDEQTTVDDLIVNMSEFLEGSGAGPYSHKNMKRKLKEHFGDDVLITIINRKENVATLRCTVENILLEFHGNQSGDERQIFIEAASKLITGGHQSYGDI